MTDRDDEPIDGEAPSSLGEYLAIIVDLLAEIPAKYRLVVLRLLWIGMSAEARSEALAFPGGFETERDRQVAILSKLLAMTITDKPDLEAERLMEEGDWEGMDEYLKRRFGDRDK
jgi:hypothetical protein